MLLCSSLFEPIPSCCYLVVTRQVQKFEKNGGVAKVIGISKLRTKYESHEAKRQLCKMYDIFLAGEGAPGNGEG